MGNVVWVAPLILPMLMASFLIAWIGLICLGVVKAIIQSIVE